MPRPRLHPDAAARLRAYRHRQKHPTQGHVLAAQTPGRYVWDLAALVAEGQRFACLYVDPPWRYDDQPPRGGADASWR